MLNTGAGESRVILFKGAGADFCLGRESMGQPPPTPGPEAYMVRDRSEIIFNLYGAFRNAKAPIIGIVQGRAVGLGCALAALCDITIASEKARFQFPETAHRIMPTIAFSALGRSCTAQGCNLYDLFDRGDRRAQSVDVRSGEQRRAGHELNANVNCTRSSISRKCRCPRSSRSKNTPAARSISALRQRPTSRATCTQRSIAFPGCAA